MGWLSCCRERQKPSLNSELDRHKAMKRISYENIGVNILFGTSILLTLVAIVAAVALILLFGPLFPHVHIAITIAICFVAAGVTGGGLITFGGACVLKSRVWNAQQQLIQHFQKIQSPNLGELT